MFRFFVWREIKVRYAQSVLGVSWAIFQPLVSALIFLIAFGYFAKIPTDSDSPRFLFYFCALVPWTFFSNAVVDGTASLVNNAQMIGKVYFPRIVLPLSAMVARLFDFLIASLVLCILMLVEGIRPTSGIVFVPLLMAIMLLAAVGVGLWLATLAVQYRDVKYATSFLVQLMMFASPVVYPLSGVPSSLQVGPATINPQLIFSLNPMVGVIEGFRSVLLGTGAAPWTAIAIGGVSSLSIALTGVWFFCRRESVFADIA